MHPVLFHFKNITIYSYGFSVGLAVLISFFLARHLAKMRNLPDAIIMDLIFFMFLTGVIGARLFYVLQHYPDYEGEYWKIFSLQEGGLVWYGGFIIASISSLLYASIHRWPLLKLSDLFATVLPLAHAIGRLGCFFNGCCYGRQTDHLFGIHFPGDDVLRHPTQLYEAGALTLLFLLLYGLYVNKRRDGDVFIAYLFYYSLLRFIIEFFRGDQRIWCTLTYPQWTSIFLGLGALFLWAIIRKKGVKRS